MAEPEPAAAAGADSTAAIAALTSRLDTLQTELDEARTRLARQEAGQPTASRVSSALDDDVWATPKVWGDVVKPGDVSSIYLVWDMIERGLKSVSLPASQIAWCKALFRTVTPFLLSEDNAVRQSPEVSEALLRVATEYLICVMIHEHPKTPCAKIRSICDGATSGSVNIVRARKLLAKNVD